MLFSTHVTKRKQLATTYLSNQFLVRRDILIWPKRLLEECQQNGDDDACLEGLSEDDEEHYKTSQ